MKKNEISFSKPIIKILCGLFILFIAAISLLPFFWVFISSFMQNRDIISGVVGFPNGIQFDNYVKAFRIAPLARFYVNSVIVAVGGTSLNLIVMSMAAYVIARFRFRLNTIVKFLFTSVLFIPCAALLLPLYISINTMHLYDNVLGLILVYAGLGMATTFYIMMSYFLTIPVTLEEAAYLDGASFFYTFFKIILPISKPGFATAGVLQFLLCWNEFQFALVLTTGDNARTLPIALYYFTSQFASDYGAMFAATSLIALPSIIIYCLLQKQVISGLTVGAVKG